MKQLILDLQSNGGGYLNIAIDLADEFLADDKLIVYTEGSKQRREDAKSSKKGLFENGRLVILVTRLLLLPARLYPEPVQDWDRGVNHRQTYLWQGIGSKTHSPTRWIDDPPYCFALLYAYSRCIQKPYENGIKLCITGN
jgi:carboxyl-terminal processing protease